MTHSNNTSRSFVAVLNKIGIGYAMEVTVDSGFVFIIDIINICSIILFFKFVAVNLCIISLVSTRDDFLSRNYISNVFELSNDDASATNYIDTINDPISMYWLLYQMMMQQLVINMQIIIMI